MVSNNDEKVKRLFFYFTSVVLMEANKMDKNDGNVYGGISLNGSFL